MRAFEGGLPDDSDGPVLADQATTLDLLPDRAPDSDLSGPCAGTSVDPQTLVLIRFDSLEGATLANAAGSKHSGTLRGTEGHLVAAQPGCGKAVQIPDAQASGSFVEIADSPAWDLLQGSIDLWVRFDASTQGYRGIVGRDALSFHEDGHLTVARTCDGSILARLQHGGNSYAQCSHPGLPTGAWIHVGVNFGPVTGLQLFINGSQHKRTGDVMTAAHALATKCLRVETCDKTIDKGIAGNDNPWVIGAVTKFSIDGGATPVHFSLGGAIDDLRISSVTREFTPP